MLMLYANSWGEWGFGLGHLQYGFGADSVDLYTQAARWAVAFRTVELNPDALLEKIG
jgi:hypothetical protein